MFIVTNAEGQVELAIPSDQWSKASAEVEAAFPRHTPVYSVGDPLIEDIEHLHDDTRRANPPADMPFEAMRISGLPWNEKYGVGITLAQVLAAFPLNDRGLRDAHAALLKFFPNKPELFGYAAWASPRLMAENLLKSNTKTTKAIKGADGMIEPSYSVGLNLMPYAFGALLSATSVREQREAYERDEKNQELRPVAYRSLPLIAPALDLKPHETPAQYAARRRELGLEPKRGMVWSLEKMQGLCVGSSRECRASCLVFTGQNGAVKYNDLSKMYAERALFFEPLAFARMLIESIDAHYAYCRRAGLRPYVRLNVYSDICWELFFPDLFDHFEAKYGHDPKRGGLWFYDYTKVQGRAARPRPNYDLTFSYSGNNLAATKTALESGMRVAVVFAREVARGTKKTTYWVSDARLAPKGLQILAMSKAEARAKYERETGGRKAGDVERLKRPNYTPAETITDIEFAPWGGGKGYQVIDGDPYDMRPLDPGGVVVGLRFKAPKRIVEIKRPSRADKLQVVQRQGKEAIADVTKSFVVKPPRANEHFIVRAERLDNEWFFSAVTPPQTNVSLATELNLSAAE
jgi:hypothetical protein